MGRPQASKARHALLLDSQGLKILGISAFYHDSAACLVVDGEIVAAAQEERFTRTKHDAAFPRHAVAYCIEQAGRAADIDHVVFYEQPFLKFRRLLATQFAFAPAGAAPFVEAMRVWLGGKIFQKATICEALREVAGGDIDWSRRLLWSEHHLSHAASAFFPSPFAEAAVLTMDGVGEWATTSLAVGHGHRIEVLKEIRFPHSLGLLYSAMTYYIGFKVLSGEYKVMGLAPYGEPKYAGLIKDRLIDIKDDGSVTIASVSAEAGRAAQLRIEQITADVEVGKTYEGPVTRLLDFGALVQVLPGREGLLHISQIANERVNAVADYLKEGQVVRVKVLEMDDKGRMRLSMKALLNDTKPADAAPAA